MDTRMHLSIVLTQTKHCPLLSLSSLDPSRTWKLVQVDGSVAGGMRGEFRGRSRKGQDGEDDKRYHAKLPRWLR